MKGHGRSYGAISVMNAIPCGIGSTIGIELTTDVEFSDSDTIFYAEGLSIWAQILQ